MSGKFLYDFASHNLRLSYELIITEDGVRIIISNIKVHKRAHALDLICKIADKSDFSKDKYDVKFSDLLREKLDKPIIYVDLYRAEYKPSFSTKLFYGSRAPKEVTESIGMLKYVVNNHSSIVNDDNVVCISIGDGGGPRTGAIIAYSTKWKVFSIDPDMRESWTTDDAVDSIGISHDKLKCRKMMFEDWLETHESKDMDGIKQIILVCVHSHNLFTCDASIDSLKERWNKCDISLSTMPCCVNQMITDVPKNVQMDDNIISAKNIMFHWTWNTSPK
jgi:hypothetical protein